MSLFLDCEFDGHEGRLISIALVADDGDEFYEVMHDALINDTNDWVKEHVWPMLNKAPTNKPYGWRDDLHDFLRKHVGETIVADSPADFWYLMGLVHEMKNGKYRYINLDLNMSFVISGQYQSKIPHNALEDAKALKEWFNKNITQFHSFEHARASETTTPAP